MTENNAAQPGLTDEQILLTMRVHLNYGDGGYVCDTAPETVIAAGRALLSKLRAEGVQAGDEVEWAGYRPLLRDAIAAKDAMHEAGIQYAKFGVMFPEMMRRYAAALASAAASKPKRPPVDDGICWSSKEIQRRQKEEDAARAAYHHSRASAPVAGEAQSRGKFLPEHVTQQMIWNVQAVIEAECNGLALDTRQARNVMSFLMSEHGHDAAPQASALAEEYARGRADGFDAAKAAPQASEAVRVQQLEAARNGAIEEVITLLENHITVSHFEFCDSPEGPTNLIVSRSGQEVMTEAIAAIRALKTQADKDGGDCAKGARDVDLMRFALEAIEAEMDPKWECNSYHPMLRTAADKLRAALPAQKQGDSDA